MKRAKKLEENCVVGRIGLDVQHKPKLNQVVSTHVQVKNKQCSVCESRLTIIELGNHLCNSDEKEIVCEYCSVSFSTTITLLEHINIHDQKLYKCEKCPKFFPMIRLKELHMLNHKFEPKTFICKICSQSFVNESRLKAHRDNQHTTESGLYDAAKQMHSF